MFDWLASWFASWVGTVGSSIATLIHLAVRAVTGWAGNIFSLVGKSWSDFYKTHLEFFTALEHFAWRVWRHFESILKHDFPLIWRFSYWLFHRLTKLVKWLWRNIVRDFHTLIRFIERVRNDIIKWVHRDIYLPLKSFADHIWHDLIKWGYTAWYYITHPDKLAAMLFWFIIGLLEQNAWKAATMLGEFITALFLHNIRKVALLLEDIFHAVF